MDMISLSCLYLFKLFALLWVLVSLSDTLPAGLRVSTDYVPAGVRVSTAAIPAGVRVSTAAIPAGVQVSTAAVPAGVWVRTGAVGRRSWTKVQQRKAPGFMMDLYEQQLQNSSVLQGTIVRSFPGRSDGTCHVFNLTSLSQGERIIKAEFRWFNPHQSLWKGSDFHTVDLFEVLEGQAKPWRETLITSRVIPDNMGEWEVFNITQTVTQWIHSNHTVSGVVALSTSSSGPLMEAERQAGQDKRFEKNGAYLVLYSDDVQRHSGAGQNTESPIEFLEYKSSQQAPVRRRRGASTLSRVVCQRTPLYVDFSKLGWSSWIISPKGYNAYHCTGSCPFPLGGNFRATNHAIVQSIVNTLKLSQDVRRPCCVPDELHPISLLYFDDEENVVLKQYGDMVVGNCGCH